MQRCAKGDIAKISPSKIFEISPVGTCKFLVILGEISGISGF